VTLDDGSTLEAPCVVVAADGGSASQLLPESLRSPLAGRRWKATRMVAFAADASPLRSRTLVVSGDAAGPIDNLTVPSDVAAGYAPLGTSLITVSVRGDWSGESVEDAVERQAAGWFGRAVDGWRHLATVEVPRALPDESPVARRSRTVLPRLVAGLWLCGDHCGAASINGALASGRQCAESILATG
jgi:hypothetical protein